MDSSMARPGPTIPLGHPFTNVQSIQYWSATTAVDVPQDVWTVNFELNQVAINVKAFSFPVWCVRGENNADVY